MGCVHSLFPYRTGYDQIYQSGCRPIGTKQIGFVRFYNNSNCILNVRQRWTNSAVKSIRPQECCVVCTSNLETWEEKLMTMESIFMGEPIHIDEKEHIGHVENNDIHVDPNVIKEWKTIIESVYPPSEQFFVRIGFSMQSNGIVMNVFLEGLESKKYDDEPENPADYQ